MYAVFRVDTEKKGKVDEVLKDDLVSRQSISVQDAEALGIDMDGTVMLLEGSEESVSRAEELFEDVGERLEDAAAEDVRSAFKRQEEDVAAGVGMIFG